MIISRTPFRISFFGGGTDYPAWYTEHPGRVLGTTINKYCYITCRYLPPFFDHKTRVIYSKIEHVNDNTAIEHPSVRECLKFMKIKKGVEIHHDGDLPARTGLGSSSSFTVGLLHALYALKGVMPSKRQLALDAIHLEQGPMAEHVGAQDQALAAFGGLNLINFGGADHVQVVPVTINPQRLKLLQKHLMLFFTGFSRIASVIAEEQVKKTSSHKCELKTMYDMAGQALDILNSPADIGDFGTLLHESWLIKKSLSDKISNSMLDGIYDRGRAAGALGGKILGAGGGGFMLFFARPEHHETIKEKLSGLLHVPFRFEGLGSQIIFHTPWETMHDT